MNWIALAILGLMLSFLSFIVVRSRDEKRSRREKLADTDTLSNALLEWGPLVLRRSGTMRGVKRFANRARFLTMDYEPTCMIPQLVSLVALEEAGFIDLSVDQFDFQKWKDGDLWTSARSSLLQSPETKEWVATIEKLLAAMTKEHWNRYQALVTGNRFSEQ